MLFGICVKPQDLFEPQGGRGTGDVTAALVDAGVDYLDMPVGAVTVPEPEWEQLRERLMALPMPVSAFMGFLPGTQRVTGPEVNLGAVLDFCRFSLGRCKALGGSVVVLGSAGARSVPPGFDPQEARAQFVEFCRALGPVAEDVGIDIAVEPLSTLEDNLLVSVEDGTRLVDEIGHPRIRLLADLHHMSVEGEPMSAVAAAGARLRHTHLADVGRVAPGYAVAGEADFVGFFRALREAGYGERADARCSFEGKIEDLAAQAGPMMAVLRARWERSGED